jgi:hypothetical protein
MSAGATQGRHLETYIGDGAYAYVAEYRSLVFYTSDGVSEKNRVEIDVGDIDNLMRWLGSAVKIAKGE